MASAIQEITSRVALAYGEIKSVLGKNPDGLLADILIEQVLDTHPDLTEAIVREAIWQGLDKDWILRPDRHLDLAA